MSATSRRAGGPSGTGEAALVGGVVGLVVAVVGLVTLGVRVGGRLDGDTARLPVNPFALVIEVVTGKLAWPASATWVVVAALAVLVVSAGAIWWRIARGQGARVPVDRAAARMGRGRDLDGLSLRGANEKARRFGVDAPGLPLGQTVAGGRRLYSSWEDVSLAICGPRTGKTVAYGVPSILDAPGAVVATSNKRDLVDATRGPRAERGETRVFDPQAIINEPCGWWWNPLSYVTDESTAAQLAEVFATADRDPRAQTDSYFEPEGQNLLAAMLLAAAVDARPITQVYLWLTRPDDAEPVEVLRGSYPLRASTLAGFVNLSPKQRDGLYGTARGAVMFLANSATTPWVTASDGHRPEFDPHAFVGSTSTLYSISKEGRGTCGALVAALTMAVCAAAETRAKVSPGGRLAVPLVCVLDEAANVCRWRELPNLYSHFGSRGVCVLTILQSWSQGVEVWGRDGMRKLWSAANIKIYGGGVAEVEFLGELSQLIGDYDLTTTSTSTGKSGRSTSRSTRRDRILDVADLAAMPRGRAVVFASGAPATLVRTLPWMDGPHAEKIRASLAVNDPGQPAEAPVALALPA